VFDLVESPRLFRDQLIELTGWCELSESQMGLQPAVQVAYAQHRSAQGSARSTELYQAAPSTSRCLAAASASAS
jgi:hypothetical protein